MNPAPPPRAQSVLALVAVLCLLGCAPATPAPPAQPPHTQWVRANGSQPTRAEFDAAAERCNARVNEETLLRGRRHRYVDWGVRMIACMNEEGFTRRGEASSSD